MSSSKSIRDETGFRYKGPPGWLHSLLRGSFFISCSYHSAPRNELKKYCIDCDLSLCHQCTDAGTHISHRVLQLYRHVYTDVVPLDEMEKHVDCSRIQIYRSNKQQVVSLNPLPHCGSQTSGEATCDTCNRKLMDPNTNSYCSVRCKVEAFSRKKNNSEPPFLALEDPSQPRPRKRSRKGIPRRAPLF